MMTNKEAALETIRVLTHSLIAENLTDQELIYLKVAEDIIRAITTNLGPLYPIKKHLEEIYNVPDLDVCVDYYTHDQPDVGNHESDYTY